MKKEYWIEFLIGLGFVVPSILQAQPSRIPPSAEVGSVMEPGEMIEPNQLPAGYSYPAAYRPSEDWDFFLTGDYLFWMASQDGMIMPAVVVDPVDTGQGVYGTYLNVQPLDTTFKSGFKVGLGWQMPNIDHWLIRFEYTWYHQTFAHSIHSATFSSIGLNSLALPSAPIVTDTAFTLASNDSLVLAVSGTDVTIKQQWHLAVDILDGMFERPYYLGTRVVVNPEVGIRAMWIEQTVRYINVNSDAVASTQIKYHSNNWGLGPRCVAKANWFLGAGISFVSKFGMSVLFTQYNEIYRKDNNLVSTGPIYRQGDEINVLRPQVETGLGVQWGSYLKENSLYLDLSASYEFNVFMNTEYPGSLYLHGLAVRAGIDF